MKEMVVRAVMYATVAARMRIRFDARHGSRLGSFMLAGFFAGVFMQVNEMAGMRVDGMRQRNEVQGQKRRPQHQRKHGGGA